MSESRVRLSREKPDLSIWFDLANCRMDVSVCKGKAAKVNVNKLLTCPHGCTVNRYNHHRRCANRSLIKSKAHMKEKLVRKIA